jgi:hypothetical protein
MLRPGGLPLAVGEGRNTDAFGRVRTSVVSTVASGQTTHNESVIGATQPFGAISSGQREFVLGGMQARPCQG